MFSLFRQRPTRGFDLVTRYYDPLKEARDERLRKVRSVAMVEEERRADRELFAERMRHSWHRQSSDRTQLIRLLLIMGMVIAILYFIVKGFGLLEYWNA